MKGWFGGGGGIRTHGDASATTVFKTVPLNHSGTPPRSILRAFEYYVGSAHHHLRPQVDAPLTSPLFHCQRRPHPRPAMSRHRAAQFVLPTLCHSLPQFHARFRYQRHVRIFPVREIDRGRLPIQPARLLPVDLFDRESCSVSPSFHSVIATSSTVFGSE